MAHRKVEQRPKRMATTQQLANGIPLFLDQLTRTLRAEEADDDAESLRISGPSGGDLLAVFHAIPGHSRLRRLRGGQVNEVAIATLEA